MGYTHAVKQNETRLTRFNGDMTVKPAVDLVLIIDRSGSMCGNENAINKYYAEMLGTARASGRQVTLTTILFDDNDSIELACGGKKIENADKLNYQIGGATALYDAYGAAIMYENKRKTDPKNPYPYADVLYVGMTDGQENDSAKFNLDTLRQLMLAERKRSEDGMGRREFAQITEFGVNKEKIGEEFMLEDKAMQTFFRGEKGLRALFQTVMLALKNMFEDRQITEKWKQLSDRLPIGKLSLGQLKEVAGSSEKLLLDNEGPLEQLELLSADGLTPEFQKLYSECYAKVKGVNEALTVLNRDPELMEIMSQYIGKNSNTVDASFNRAVSKSFADISANLHLDLAALLGGAEDMEISAADFEILLQKYKDDMDKLRAIPRICAHMRKEPTQISALEIRAGVIADIQNKEYNGIIDLAFNARYPLLRQAERNRNAAAFDRLGKFADGNIARILSGNPSYNKFFELHNYLRTKMPQREQPQKGQPETEIAR